MNFSRILSMLLCFVMVMSLFTGFVGTASADDNVIEYTAQQGDYLFKVCKANGLDYYQCKQAIMALNGFTSEQQLNRISVGQKIKLPANNSIAASVKTSSVTTTTVATTTTIGGVATTTTTTSTVSGTPGTAGVAAAFYLTPHVIASGETLNSICNGLDASYANNSSMILAMNGISNPNAIKAGKTVYIPTSTASAGGYAVVEHTVSSGENLTDICRQYGTDYPSSAQLINGLNAGKDVSRIYANQKLYIPIPVANASGLISSPLTVAPATPGAPVAGVAGGYAIKFESAVNGSPYATVNGAKVTSAAKDARVQIVSNANEGYNIKSVSVTRLDTKANVIVKENAFTMPSSEVSVKVTYSDAMRLTKASASYGSFKLLVNGSEEAYANYGDVITAVSTPSDGYAVAKVTYKNSTDGSNEKTVYPDGTGAYKFNMPNYPTTVTVLFKKAAYYKINTEIVASGSGRGSVSYSYNGSAISKAAANTVVTVNMTPNDGCSVWLIRVNGKGYGSYGLTKISNTCFTFVMPEADVTVSVEFYKESSYNITQTRKDGGSLQFAVYDPIKNKTYHQASTAKAGELVIVVPQPASGYKFNKGQTSVRYSNGESKVTLSDYDAAYGGYTFTMPAADTNVNPAWDKAVKRYNLSNKACEHGSFYLKVDDGNGNMISTMTSEAGKVVDIYLSPDAGYVVAKDKKGYDHVYFSYNGIDYVATKITDTHYQFTMPACDVVVSVVFERLNQFATITKTIEGIGDIIPGAMSVKANGIEIDSVSSNVKAGTTITITCTAADGYSLSQLSVNGSTSGLSKQSEGVYTYTCQTSDVTTGINLYAVYNAVSYTVQYSNPDAFGSYELWVGGTNRGSADVSDAHFRQSVVIKNITALDPTKYVLDQVIVGDDDVTADYLADGEYAFSMPLGNIITRVTFKPVVDPVPVVYSISVGSVTGAGGSLVFTPASAEAGKTVSVASDSALTVKSITLKDSGGNDVSYEYVSGTSFTMPSCDVTVDAVTE